ncbi:MAG: PAS domain S-box protein [Phycisphaerales bacterium]|nr:PAS domain S-box protein [Phycisphaerales bacterium]
MFSRLPMKLTAALLIGLPVLIVGLLLSMMWHGQSREAVKGLADSDLKQLHSLVSIKINDLLSIPSRVCRLNERLVQEGVLDPDNLDSWWPIYSREFDSFEMLSSIVWGDADGRALWIGRYSDGDIYWAVKKDGAAETMDQWRLAPDGSLPNEPPVSFSYNLFERPWFQAPVEVGGPTWTDPFVWAGGDEDGPATLGIAYGIPLYHPDGTLQGVVDADLSLNDLSTFLRSIVIGRTGMTAVIEEQGRILATSSKLEFIAPDGTLRRISDVADARADAASSMLGEAPYQMPFSGTIESDGEVYYMQATPVGNEFGLDWSLVSIVPEQDFLAEIDAGFRQSSIVSLIAVVLAILVGLISTRWLVTPLRTLVESVRRIGQGDLQTRVHIRHASEYVELSNAVNEMASGLQDRIHVRERLEATTQSMLDAMITMDYRGKIVEFNKAAETIFDYTREEVLNQPLAECIIPPDLRKAHAAGMKHYEATGEGPVLNNRIEITGMKSDGSLFPIELTIVPFDFEGGKHFTATIRDITEQKARQDELDELRHREDLLRRELDHRVKNMLAQILTLSRQTAERAESDKELLDSLVGKIFSLSSVHELLGKSGQASLQFTELLEMCCQPYLHDESQLQSDGTTLLVLPQSAMCLSLICNELANNSRKHGALKVPEGRIETRWSIKDGMFVWTWSEHGGPEVPDVIRPSFGMQMLESLIPYELDGEVDISLAADGLVFESSIPIEHVRGAQEV